MREIPELQILCLRAVGSQACSTEKTFAQLENGETSQASRLLRRFHRRPTQVTSSNYDDEETEIIEYDTVEYDNNVPLSRKPCIGPGSARRVNANEVDLNHPLIGCRMPISSPDDSGGRQKYMTVMQYGSPALDSLQLYIDSLVELGRMNDSRLGIRFFEEWKANVQLQSARTTTNDPQDVKLPDQVIKKRKRGYNGSNKVATPEIYAFGSLSLHNCTLSYDTLDAMIKSGMGPHLAVLDLTGVHGVTDEFTNQLFQPAVCPNLRRLSLKNCRKVSGKTLRLLPTACSDSLECLDIGGCFNISASIDVLPVIELLPKLSELHASGLQWDDSLVSILVDRKSDTKTLKRKTNSDLTTMSPWQCLSLGFSTQFTQTVLRECLMQIADTLQSLALPFCETVVDNALLGIFGRNLPHIKYLDLRGNSSLNTVTGWYDGRVSADLSPSQELTILGRYTSLTEASIEETRRVHPHAVTTLTVILDGGGMGAGIAREYL